MFLTFLKATDSFHIIYNNKNTGKRNRKNISTNDIDKANEILNDFKFHYNAYKSSVLPAEQSKLEEQKKVKLIKPNERWISDNQSIL